MTAADYVDMYREVVGELRGHGVDNVVYVMNYLGFDNWAPVVDKFYPGDDVVDWIGYDPYGFAAQTDFALLLNFPTDDWDGFYEWATQKAPGKPILLGEFGFDLASQREAPSIIVTAPEVLAESFPMVKALVYWNDRIPGGLDMRLDQPTRVGGAYGRAYAAMADDPYFNRTSTDHAP
jgi:hypothetical protein